MKTKKDSGVVLVLVMCLTAVAGVLAAGLVAVTTSQVKSARRYSNHEQAFYIAEAGIERAASVLNDENDLDNVLTNWTSIFTNPGNFAGGEYQITITDNNDGDGNMFADIDDTIIVNSTGTFENAIRVIEAAMTIPASVTGIPAVVDAPLSYYGTNSTLTLIGSGGKIDGNDYDIPDNFVCSGINCWGDLTTNAASTSSVYTATNLTVTGESKIEAPPPNRIITGGGMYTEEYWIALANALIPLADLTISGTVSYAGASQPIGTRTDPKLTVVTTNSALNITGGVDGAGILILQDGATFNPGGNFHYEGLIIAFGSAAVEISAHGTPKISGGVVCIGEGDVNLTGSGGIRYSSAALANLANLDLGTNTISFVYWREIK